MSKEYTSPSLGVLELSSIPTGYFLVNEIFKSSNVNVIEASIVSPDKFVIIFDGLLPDTGKAFQHVENLNLRQVLDCCHLMFYKKQLLDSYYGLTRSNIKNTFGVVEAETLSSAFRLGHEVLKYDELEVLDIKSSRGLGSKNLVLLTGTEKLKQFFIDYKPTTTADMKIHFQVIEKPEPAFLKFFNPSGEL